MPKPPEQPKFSEKESEPVPKPVYIVYRDNDLFRRCVPVIQTFLEEQGYTVNLQVFPVGTPEEEIKNWYLVHQTELQKEGTLILADFTSQRSTEYKLEPRISLDSFFRKIMVEYITGDPTLMRGYVEQIFYKAFENRDNPEELRKIKEEYLSKLGEVFIRILATIPEEKRQEMKIVILKGLIKGHTLLPPLIEHEPYFVAVPKMKENFEELQKETDEFTEKMREWLIKAGIPEPNIFVFSTAAEIPQGIMEELIQGENTYIIFDRHTTTKETIITVSEPEYRQDVLDFWGPYLMHSSSIEKRAALRMPVETFFFDVLEKIYEKEGITISDPRKMEELIRAKLSEVISKEGE